MATIKKPLTEPIKTTTGNKPLVHEALSSKAFMSAASGKAYLKTRKPSLKKASTVLDEEVINTYGVDIGYTELISSSPKVNVRAALVAQSDVRTLTDSALSSSEPYDLLISSNSQAITPTFNTSENLSTGTMLGIGLLAVGGVGTAIAVSTRSSNSNATSYAQQDTTAPIIQSIKAQSTNRTVELTYNEALDPLHLPGIESFVVTTNGQANSVDDVSVNGNVLTLSLHDNFDPGSLVLKYRDITSGNDTEAIQDIAGNDATGFMQGIVADGYVSGAQIYIDHNGDGLADANEALPGVITDQNGNFLVADTLLNGTIIAVGGFNIDTGKPQLTPLKAPANSTIINPLTTLVQAILDNGDAPSVEAASHILATTLSINLAPGRQLTDYDPIAVADLVGQKAAAQIATVLSLVTNGDPITAHTAVSMLATIVADQYTSGVTNTAMDDLVTPWLDVLDIEAGLNTGLNSDLRDQIIESVTTIKQANSISEIGSAQANASSDSLINFLTTQSTSLLSQAFSSGNNTTLPLTGNLTTASASVAAAVIQDITSSLGTISNSVKSGSNTTSNKIELFPDGGASQSFFTLDPIEQTFQLFLDRTVPIINIPLVNDLGFSAASSLLSMNLDADATCTASYTILLEGGWNSNDGFYLNAATPQETEKSILDELIFDPFYDAINILKASSNANASCCQVQLDFRLPLEMQGIFGPFMADVTDTVGENSGRTTGLYADFTAQLSDEDEKFTASDMYDTLNGTKNVSEFLAVQLNAGGDISLHISLDDNNSVAAMNTFIKSIYPNADLSVLDSTTSFISRYLTPGFSFDLEIPAGIAVTSAAGVTNTKTALGDIYLNNMSLSIDDLLNWLPIVDITRGVLHIADAVKVLNAPIALYATPQESSFKWDTNKDIFSNLGDAAWDFVTTGASHLLSGATDAIGAHLLKSLDLNQNNVTTINELFHAVTYFMNLICDLDAAELALMSAMSLDPFKSDAEYLTILDVMLSPSDDMKTHEFSIAQTMLHNMSQTEFTAFCIGMSQLEDSFSGILDTFNYICTVIDTVEYAANMALTIDSLLSNIQQDPESKKISLNFGDTVIHLLGDDGTPLQTPVFTPTLHTSSQSSGLIDVAANSGNPLLEQVADLVYTLNDIGINLPVLQNADSLAKILTMQPVDLINYNLEIPKLDLFHLDFPVYKVSDSSNISFDSTFSMSADVLFGVDTYGIIQWFQHGLSDIGDLAEGVYFGTNTPENPLFSMTIDPSFGFKGDWSAWDSKITASVDAALGAIFTDSVFIDSQYVANGTEGKIRLNNFLSEWENGNLLSGLFDNVIRVDGTYYASVDAAIITKDIPYVGPILPDTITTSAVVSGTFPIYPLPTDQTVIG